MLYKAFNSTALNLFYVLLYHFPDNKNLLQQKIVKLKADKDKFSRALPLSAKMESGLVFYPTDTMWYADLEKELLTFPVGEHDDQVDALAYAVLEVQNKKSFKAF